MTHPLDFLRKERERERERAQKVSNGLILQEGRYLLFGDWQGFAKQACIIMTVIVSKNAAILWVESYTKKKTFNLRALI